MINSHFQILKEYHRKEVWPLIYFVQYNMRYIMTKNDIDQAAEISP